MNDLQNKGYIVIKNNNPNAFAAMAERFYNNNNNVDYGALKQFIDYTYFPSLQKYTNCIDNLHYGKFRFSDNNNSTDAANFHGDIYNHSDENVVPVYTCLYYFDDATLEIIPQTHKQTFLHDNNSHKSYEQRDRINIKAGTFIIFHASIHHRGVGFNGTGRRRLLQIFEVTFNDNDYEHYCPKIRIVEMQNSAAVRKFGTIAKYIYKASNPELLNRLHYFLTYNNIQYKLVGLDITPSQKNGMLVTYEPGKRVSIEKCKERHDTNVNVICDHMLDRCEPGTAYLYIHIISLLLVVIAIYLLYKERRLIKRSLNKLLGTRFFKIGRKQR